MYTQACMRSVYCMLQQLAPTTDITSACWAQWLIAALNLSNLHPAQWDTDTLTAHRKFTTTFPKILTIGSDFIQNDFQSPLKVYPQYLCRRRRRTDTADASVRRVGCRHADTRDLVPGGFRGSYISWELP